MDNMTKIKKVSKKIIVGGLVALLIVAGAGALYIKNRNDATKSTDVASSPQETLNLDPPTDEDAKRADENKQEILRRDEELKTQQTTTETSGKKNVKPVITYAGQYGNSVEAGGYVNVFEEGGTCTATFTRGSAKITKTVQAIRGANSVNCPVMAANSSEFSQKGTYSVTVSYNSATSTGVSDTKQLEVK